MPKKFYEFSETLKSNRWDQDPSFKMTHYAFKCIGPYYRAEFDFTVANNREDHLKAAALWDTPPRDLFNLKGNGIICVPGTGSSHFVKHEGEIHRMSWLGNGQFPKLFYTKTSGSFDEI